MADSDQGSGNGKGSGNGNGSGTNLPAVLTAAFALFGVGLAAIGLTGSTDLRVVLAVSVAT
jgi:hypothetical protein